MLNLGINFLTVGIINKNRKRLGMAPFRDQGVYAPAMADNFLMFSPALGNTDPDWKYKWHIGGYCFNDDLPYDKETYEKLKAFVKKDKRPVLFFTMGSCKTKKMNDICHWLLDICRSQSYKLVLGCGWWHTGTELASEDCFPLDSVIPHNLIFPFFDGIIHHGGSGTTHSAGRAGVPQMVLPIFVDQHYWGLRIFEMGIGPHYLPVPKITRKSLEAKAVDLMGNEKYKKNAAALSEKIQAEDGIVSLCEHIESYAQLA
jgi:UDP:flavonoid glycosyltransferase YjiC (YdhE family)